MEEVTLLDDRKKQEEGTMTRSRYEVEPRPLDLGGGFPLRLFKDGEEVGGGVFPLDEFPAAVRLISSLAK
jgi:hypothetical protein